MARKDGRFVITYSQDGVFRESCILVDRQTGVNYLFLQSANAGGLTPLLNRDGSPVISPLPIEAE